MHAAIAGSSAIGLVLVVAVLTLAVVLALAIVAMRRGYRLAARFEVSKLLRAEMDLRRDPGEPGESQTSPGSPPGA